MSLNYTLVVQEDRPTKKAPGTLWLKASIGLVLLAFGNEEYVHFSAGNGNLSISDGTYYKQTINQSIPPSSPDIGQIWTQDDSTQWIWLGTWSPFGGN